MVGCVGTRAAWLLVLIVAAGIGPARAAANLVTNGNFESLIVAGSGEVGGTGSYNSVSPTVTGWNSAGYAFLFTPNAAAVSGTTADTTGATRPGFSTNLYLWGPGSGAAANGTGGTDNTQPGVANGLTNSPAGGNFIASDATAGLSGALSQSISGLAAGTNYNLTFYWAAAQQEGPNFTSGNTESWGVSFGNQTFNTAPATIAGEGFSGWMSSSMIFSATSATQVLSFLATAGPNGSPPFALLDGVSLVAAPEPAAWAMLSVGLMAMAGFGSMRRQRQGARSAR